MIFGIDRTWCEEDADKKKLTFRAFPPWLYDDSRLNDYPELLSLTGLEIAGRVLLHRFDAMPERLPPNGYEIFVPDEAIYDIPSARAFIRAMAQARTGPAPERRELRQLVPFPALAWLDEACCRGVPARRSCWPSYPSTPPCSRRRAPGDQREISCKARKTEMGRNLNAAVIDFRFRSPVT